MVPIIIGVTGHRDLKQADVQELESRIRAIFQEIQGKYRNTPIKVLSPLAEGADRLVAKVGLEIGATLIVPLPMPRLEYEKDFEAEDSKKEFANLLAKAEAPPYELPLLEGSTLENIQGYYEPRNRQYAYVGAYVALHSQILIALWNGKKSGETGGTSEIVRYKLEGVPEPYAPASSPLDFPDNGPVYHIFTRREKKQPEVTQDNHDPEVDRLSSRGKDWDVLYPPGWKGGVTKESSDETIKKAINKADEYYNCILKRIDEFNSDIKALAEPPSAIRSGFDSRLASLCNNKQVKKYFGQTVNEVRLILNVKGDEKVKDSKGYILPENNQKTLPTQGLKDILDFYGTADILAQSFQAKLKWSLIGLLSAPVIAFFFFGAFDELWSMAYILALFPIFFGVAYLLYKKAAKKDYDNKFSDYRALAEGLRVQFFWKLIGLKDNVTDHYHRKYKADMAWILQAIKNVSIKANMEALKNPSYNKREVLELVNARWIEDQRKYFEKNTGKRKANAEAQEIFTFRFFATAMFLVFGLFTMKAIILLQHGSLSNILDMNDIKNWTLYSVFLVLIDTLIATGAARSVYVEKKGFKEEAKQFQRMKDLFQKGSNVMVECLKKDDLNGAERLVIELGKEALTENGDWLILRRSKPMEVPLG